MIVSSLLLTVILLIAPFKKLKTIILKIVFVAFVVASNIVLKEPCFCYVLLAFTFLNVSANALLKSFLAFIIRLLSFS